MFGQRASSQIVCRRAPWMRLRTWSYGESALGARSFIHSGRRGRSATGSDASMETSVDAGRFGSLHSMRRVPALVGAVSTVAVCCALAIAGDGNRVETQFRSVALADDVRATVVLPSDYASGTRRYPVVYFLHGLPAAAGAHEDVAWLADALRRAGRPAILVAPQGARAGDSDPEYLDWGPGRNWETYVAQEVPRLIDARFRTIRSRAGRALVGLSAGGYGAAIVGIHHLGTFS